MILGTAMLLFGTIMTYLCLIRATSLGGGVGRITVPLAWLTPSFLLYCSRRHVLQLSRKWLVGLQLFRVIGAVILVEYGCSWQNSSHFAYPAGLGDILAAIVAAIVLWVYRNDESIPARGVYAVVVVGILVFLSAFFFRFTSSGGVGSLFETETQSLLIVFPTGMIPLFLVPCAIFYHTLSLLTHFRYGRASTTKESNSDDEGEIGAKDVEMPSIHDEEKVDGGEYRDVAIG